MCMHVKACACVCVCVPVTYVSLFLCVCVSVVICNLHANALLMQCLTTWWYYVMNSNAIYLLTSKRASVSVFTVYSLRVYRVNGIAVYGSAILACQFSLNFGISFQFSHLSLSVCDLPLGNIFRICIISWLNDFQYNLQLFLFSLCCCCCLLFGFCCCSHFNAFLSHVINEAAQASIKCHFNYLQSPFLLPFLNKYLRDTLSLSLCISTSLCRSVCLCHVAITKGQLGSRSQLLITCVQGVHQLCSSPTHKLCKLKTEKQTKNTLS